MVKAAAAAAALDELGWEDVVFCGADRIPDGFVPLDVADGREAEDWAALPPVLQS